MALVEFGEISDEQKKKWADQIWNRCIVEIWIWQKTGKSLDQLTEDEKWDLALVEMPKQVAGALYSLKFPGDKRR